MPFTRPLRATLDRRPTPAEQPSGQTGLTVGGEIDFHTVGRLCRHIQDELAQEGHLTLDLTAATFDDQAAIDAFAQVQSRAAPAGR